MEFPSPSEMSGKSSKKVKAIGAFRSLFNFLQKPSKKKMENSPTCAGVSAVTDDEVAAQVVFDHEPAAIGNEFESGYQCGDGSEGEAAVSNPEARYDPIQDDAKKLSSYDEDVDDDDDEVFLSESYFEDDYFEDFSSSSSGSVGSNVKDEEIDNLGKVKYDEMDYIDVGNIVCKDMDNSFLNNLVGCDVVAKNYDKILPRSIIWQEEGEKYKPQPELDLGCSKPLPLPLRRYSSMPSLSRDYSDVSQVPRVTHTNNNFLPGDFDFVKLLQKPIPYFGLTSDILASDLNPDNQNQDILGKSILNSNILPADISIVCSEKIKEEEKHNSKILASCRSPSPKKTVMSEGSSISPMAVSAGSSDDAKKTTTDSANNSNSDDTTPPGDNSTISATVSKKNYSDINSEKLSDPFTPTQSKNSRVKSSVCKKSKVEDSAISTLLFPPVSPKDPFKPKLRGDAITKSTWSLDVLSKRTSSSNEEKETANKKRRLYNRGSVESGYGSTRMSSGSTPHTPLVSSPLSNPMNKLHRGTPLSPQSLNKLDGFSKTKLTPKPSLKPKFILHTPKPMDSKPVLSSDVKPIRSAESEPFSQLDLDPSSLNLKSAKRLNKIGSNENTNEIENVNSKSTPLSGESTPFGNFDLCTRNVNKIGLPVPNFGIDLNSSIRFVDVNNNVLNSQNDYPHHPQTVVGTPTTTPLRSELPTTPSGCHNMMNASDIPTPFGKTIRPVCTSSPLWIKMEQRRSLTTPLKETLDQHADMTYLGYDYEMMGHVTPKTMYMKNVVEHQTGTTPLSKIGSEYTVVAPLSAHYPQPVVPHTLQFTTPTKAKQKVVEDARVVKPSSEKRKLLKRRSARTRLHFNERLDENNNLKVDDDEEEEETGESPMSTDYVLLKRIADSMIKACGSGNRDVIGSCVDLAGLMDCLNNQYSKLVENGDVWLRSRLSSLKNHVESSRLAFIDLTVDNCLNIVLMSFLTQNLNRIEASLNFCFDNLPRVVAKHQSLSHLAPEIVVLLLSNSRRVVKNHQGFPLSYSASEKEVFKAVVKYVDATVKKNGRPLEDRVKCLLSTVADLRALSDMSSRGMETFLASDAILSLQRAIIPKPPRPYHRLVFQQLCPLDHGARDYHYQPFISSSVQSLDQISSANKSAHGAASSPIVLASVCKEYYILRKLYFSFRRYNDVPFITKIGMQYSVKGKKKTAFIAPSQPTDRGFASRGESLETHEKMMESVNKEAKVDQILSTAVGVSGAETSGSPEMSLGKKAAVVLKPGEHITSLSVLGHTAVHNVEVITNIGRRIRAHGFDDVVGLKWVAMETPQGKEPCCLHALYGDAQTTAGRSYIRDLGGIWASTSYEPLPPHDVVTSQNQAINDLG